MLFGKITDPAFENKIAVQDLITGMVLTCGGLNRETALAAGIFRAFYAQNGKTVSLLLEGGVNFIVAYLGAWRAGGTPHAINPGSAPQQIIADMKLRHAEILVTEEKFLWDDEASEPSQFLRNIRQEFPELNIFAVKDPKAVRAMPRQIEETEKGGGWLGTYGWRKIMNFTEPYFGAYHNSEGLAKLLADARDLIQTYQLNGGDRAFAAEHLADAFVRLRTLYPMIMEGGEIILTQIARPDPTNFLKAVDRSYATYATVSSQFFKEMIKHPMPEKTPRKFFRFCIVDANWMTEKERLALRHSIFYWHKNEKGNYILKTVRD
ncbi:hypothetical protein A3G55_01095 [Candidatus Giovannonibacteria bacterium RIFCSPLOWO2_12_FULL_44_25]|uniref:AMP-dependent synthetase/ligase domain-containing protein n=3 Tax=Candidatus Giovannoniibacteriota TaxID=1752738 RepID=A0A0G1IAU0_9BACT|nr:MAG: hypothetical protein UW49_C0015G0005 [Candidatus Giovannonibacteria bacterium GW2011_GWB1_44_23]KKT59326.1 MAG: hypothetical protein UW53_C0015G0009 [Candidatus Giovannonibacteria bacterium GW2011_GWA1_44_25]OGF49475.1 MAG: hypothetical protein A2120_03125 [Candidatus Giovannonibacteria bacterium GWA2_45_15]OGF61367.1 MAG: hypothetical protein A2656_04395 [Candidatus Giovannonibacteria bacterium RIFCSPHIGHO2_01_FULL_44_100]OGF71716.1 MAG: hypothetical protein A3C05_03670 [Candidatus Gio